MGAPGGEGGGDGFGDALLVGGVGDRGGGRVGVGERGDLDGDGGAGEVVERAEGGLGEGDGEFGVEEGEAELVGEAEALRDGGGLGGVPGDGAGGLGRLAGRAEVMRWMPGFRLAVAWRRRQAAGRAWLAAPARWSGGRAAAGSASRVVTTAKSGGGERGFEASGEGEGDVFFEEIVGEVGSGVGASVGGVEEDEGAGLLGERGGREQDEERGEVSAGGEQGCVDCTG